MLLQARCMKHQQELTKQELTEEPTISYGEWGEKCCCLKSKQETSSIGKSLVACSIQKCIDACSIKKNTLDWNLKEWNICMCS